MKQGGEDKDKLGYASQWQLMWWKFKSHKLALISAVVLFIVYLLTLFAQYVAPYDPTERHSAYLNMPPQKIRFVDEDGFDPRPFVYAYESTFNDTTLAWDYAVDKTTQYPLRLFVHGYKYALWGIFGRGGRGQMDAHLFGVDEPGTMFLLGTDNFGRDLLSRVLIGGQISLSIGLVGVAITFVLGLLIGGISGFYGGVIDNIIQRLIELLMSIPTLPAYMALSASIPVTWPIVRVYFMMSVIFSILGWTGLARVVRGKILAIRKEDFVMASQLGGAGDGWIIRRHLLPSMVSYIIVSLTMTVPGMILGETAMSFLGLGLQVPAISWGVLLQGAQNVRTIAMQPWLLTPALAILVVVLCFNFVGDGLRDAADPYVR